MRRFAIALPMVVALLAPAPPAGADHKDDHVALRAAPDFSARQAQTDQRIATEISLLLLADPEIPVTIQVTSHNNVVRLMGRVPSERARAAAAAQARNVAGVETVKNVLEVDPGSAETVNLEPDVLLEESVARFLEQDAMLRRLRLSVRARDGVVALSGRVRDRNDLWNAARSVRLLQGVRAVRTDGVDLERVTLRPQEFAGSRPPQSPYRLYPEPEPIEVAPRFDPRFMPRAGRAAPAPIGGGMEVSPSTSSR